MHLVDILFKRSMLLFFFLDSPSVDRIVNPSNTVIEGDSFNITCQASGDPNPKNYTWINLRTAQRVYENVLQFANISRNDTGQYKCEAANRCGKGSQLHSIDVFCKCY